MEWARGNGCPWDERTCALAAEGNHIEVLKWARGNECPWDKWMYKNAEHCGNRDVMSWARDNGCPGYCAIGVPACS